MDRRTFLSTTAAAGLAAASRTMGEEQAPGAFKLKYAPAVGAFQAHAGKSPIDNIKFAADQGFSAMFDNGLMGRDPALQEQVRATMEGRGMTLGPFVMYTGWKEPTLVTGKKEVLEDVLAKTRQAVVCAQRTGARWALLVPGRCAQDLEWDYQTAHVVDMLRAVADVAEPAGLTIVIEPLNWWRNHAGQFLQKIPQAYNICRAVNRKSIKIVDDLYHQQITEGNLIANIDLAWEEIGAFHLGDNPGRKEPGTGEINYRNIFQHIHQKGYQGVLCMEHGNSKGKGIEAEKSLIAAYRRCDDFS